MRQDTSHTMHQDTPVQLLDLLVFYLESNGRCKKSVVMDNLHVLNRWGDFMD